MPCNSGYGIMYAKELVFILFCAIFLWLYTGGVHGKEIEILSADAVSWFDSWSYLISINIHFEAN